VKDHIDERPYAHLVCGPGFDPDLPEDQWETIECSRLFLDDSDKADSVGPETG